MQCRLLFPFGLQKLCTLSQAEKDLPLPLIRLRNNHIIPPAWKPDRPIRTVQGLGSFPTAFRALCLDSSCLQGSPIRKSPLSILMFARALANSHLDLANTTCVILHKWTQTGYQI
jgi:hypothetical protein